MAAQQTHELQAVSDGMAKELDPSSPVMQSLGSMIWGEQPPFQDHVTQDQSGDILANDLTSPQGVLRLTQKFGQRQVEQFKQQLVKQGKLPPTVLANQEM